MNIVAKISSGKSTRNTLLIIVALVQIVLIGIIYIPRFLPDNNESGRLLGDIKTSDIIGLKISEGEEQLSLAKDGDSWVLPEADNFPVQLDKVTPFLDKLVALDNQSLVADNKASHKRLQVTDNDFVRKIEIDLKGNKNIILYVGSSPTASDTHVRIGNQDNVYLNREFRSQDANVGASSWIEAKYFEVEQDNTIRLRLVNGQGDVTFRKVADRWKLIRPVEDENAEVDESAINSLLRKASSIRMVRPLGKEAHKDYGLDDPKATVTIVTQEELEPAESAETADVEGEVAASENSELERQTYTLTVGNELDDGFVVKSSESEYYVVVSNFNASDFVEKGKVDFIVLEETEEPSEEDVGGGTSEPEVSEDGAANEVSEEVSNEGGLEEDVLESGIDEAKTPNEEVNDGQSLETENPEANEANNPSSDETTSEEEPVASEENTSEGN